jgi:hypothetical protein
MAGITGDEIDRKSRDYRSRTNDATVRPTWRASLVSLLPGLVLFAAMPSAGAEPSAAAAKLEAEQQVRQQLEAHRFRLDEPPARLLRGPSRKERDLPQGSPTTDALLRAGTDLRAELLDPVTSQLLDGKPYTVATSLQRQTLLKENNDHLQEVFTQLKTSFDNELKALIDKIPNEGSFKIERAQLDAEFDRYKVDCSRKVPPEIFEQEQAKCDRHHQSLESRYKDLDKRVNEKLKAEAAKLLAKYEHGQPGLIEIAEKYKQNSKIIAKLQALDQRIKTSMAVFAKLCPDSIRVNDAESVKYCAAFNWDNPDPTLQPLKIIGPCCPFFCRPEERRCGT